MKRLMFVAVALASLLAIPSAQAGAIDKLHRFLESTITLRADFAQIVVAKNGRRPQQSTGVMMVSRPGKFRWQALLKATAEGVRRAIALIEAAPPKGVEWHVDVDPYHLL